RDRTVTGVQTCALPISCLRQRGVSNRDRKRSLGPRDGVIHGIALDRLATGFADEAGKLFATHSLRGGSAGVVVNLLFDHGAVNVERESVVLGRGVWVGG